jgi:hypothetical protein
MLASARCAERTPQRRVPTLDNSKLGVARRTRERNHVANV